MMFPRTSRHLQSDGRTVGRLICKLESVRAWRGFQGSKNRSSVYLLACGLPLIALSFSLGFSLEDSTDEVLARFESQAPALRSAIEDLRETFPGEYVKGERYLTELKRLETEFGQIGEDTSRQVLKENIRAFDKLHREALIANPLVSKHPILFVVRPQYKPDHHNTATLFQKGEINENSFVGGGALKTVSFGNDGKVETLLETLEGSIRDPEVHFNGDKSGLLHAG